MSFSSFSPMDIYSQPCWPQFSFPPSPTDTVASDLSYSPPPRTQSLHVFCNAPLIAPKPLPYHSPTFLQFDLLPSLDDDLSFPPYTQRPPKRKREDDSDSDRFVMHMHKRRAPNTSSFVPPRPPSVSSRHLHYHKGPNSRPHHHFGKPYHHPYHAQR
ncbi:hypothetical protein K435DRAFT_847695 [Dendrothele bispora CBS 962.96]|uniref:Uncharacterized protein n=1 Tax=Dendrothele bispora (strain CBS 962.96) TaxID=1314807 RepID=A0A4S8MXF7_DENBC|nr:hypothetical protein K435DRAFT_847695 [Dendrothele bispora CBS 962.96]